LGDLKAEKLSFSLCIFCREALGLLGTGSGCLESGQEGALEGFGGVTSKYFSGDLSRYLSRYP
jgi:hypothetical protein